MQIETSGHMTLDQMHDSNEINNNFHSEKIYLDYNATTPLANEVAEVIATSLVENWHNPSSQYKKGKESKALINESRLQIAQMINATSASDIIFVSGGTEANNLAFYSILRHYDECKKIAENKNKKINQLPHIIISKIEHDSIKLIADRYKKDGLADVTEIEVNSHGCVEVSNVIGSIKPNTILISIMLANNETGVIQPIKEIGAELKRLNLRKPVDFSERMCPLFLHTDTAQAIGKIKVDVDDLQVDYLTVVGHKFYGPKIGALYARNCLGKKFSENDSSIVKTPVHHPFYGASQESGLRPGTENTPMICGLGKAAELITKNLTSYHINMKEKRDYLEARLVDEFGAENLKFNGKSTKSERLPNTCNVSFISSPELKGYLILGNSTTVEASTGACCHSGELRASKILLAMQIDKSVANNAIRLSVGRETTYSQIELAIRDLRQSVDKIINENP